jgi:hypothetical protein
MLGNVPHVCLGANPTLSQREWAGLGLVSCKPFILWPKKRRAGRLWAFTHVRTVDDWKDVKFSEL